MAVCDLSICLPKTILQVISNTIMPILKLIKTHILDFFSEANMELIVFPITTITTRHNIPFTLKNLAIHHTIEY